VPSVEKKKELTAALKAGNDFVALRFQSLLNDTDAFGFGSRSSGENSCFFIAAWLQAI